MNALLMPHAYDDHVKKAEVGKNWQNRFQYLVDGLLANGINTYKHPLFKCDLNNALDFCEDVKYDITIYNHADESYNYAEKGKYNWYFKPTIPTEDHATLDPMGYGSYTVATYSKPPFLQCKLKDAQNFIDTKVKSWIDSGDSKWGKVLPVIDTEEKDYVLVLAQCEADYSVKRHDFGDYTTRINAIVDEILSCSNKKIIVKGHPYCRVSIFNDDPRVQVVRGKYSSHELIKYSYCVVLANSGAGFEALFHDKPVICWGYPEYHWVSYDLRHLCDMKRALKLDWYNSGFVKLFLYWYFEHYCFFDSASATKRVRKLLDKS
jgi:hypothetical protein|tara:strand:- start:4749 stop:5708 length:960 start_codon:yes stop_codon:yes gene_type:complete